MALMLAVAGVTLAVVAALLRLDRRRQDD